MSKKSKAAIKILIQDISILDDMVSKLRYRVTELEDTVAFYASSLNSLEITVKSLSHDYHEGLNPSYTAFDEMQEIPSKTFKVSSKEWEYLNDALNNPAPPHVVNGLRRLFGKHEGRDA